MQYGDTTAAATYGPWSYDPADQVWWAQAGQGFAVVDGDLADPPRYHPVTGADLAADLHII